jgi:hypothetical protein
MPVERRVEAPAVQTAEEAMSDPDEGSATASTPAWAVQQATEELYSVEDAQMIAQRAREIADEGQAREDERHDQYDDPDEGGEA